MGTKINNQVLEPEIFKSLKEGTLNPILEAVKNDSELHIELRGGGEAGSYVSIYCRGRLIFKSQDTDKLTIDSKYLKNFNLPATPNVNDGVTQIDLYKKAIDNYLTTSEKDYLERQVEQQIVMANQSKDSDYLMLNMEYNMKLSEEKRKYSKIDIIALKHTPTPVITLIELKNSTSALYGKSGLEKHLTKMKDFIKNPKSAEFKEDLAKLYEQKCELGLLEYSEEIAAALKQPLKFEVMFLFTDLEEDSQTLNRILKSEEFKPNYDFDVKIAFLKDKNMKLSEKVVKPLDEFLKQIAL